MLFQMNFISRKMKNLLYIKSITIFMIALSCSLAVSSQVLFSTIPDDPDPAHNSTMAEVRSLNNGLIVPFIVLDYDGSGEVEAPNIPGTPADGLIIFHEGANGITKGLWYYDAVLPGWIIYSNWSSDFAIDINSYGELYEANVLGGGSEYPLANNYFVPWRTASPGLMGADFTFLDDNLVNTETGTAEADQVQVTGTNAVYSINISTTVTSITSGNEITGILYINDNQAANIFFRHTFQNKNFPTNCFTSGLIALNTNDKIDFRFSCTTASEGIKVEHLNMRLTKVADF